MLNTISRVLIAAVMATGILACGGGGGGSSTPSTPTPSPPPAAELPITAANATGITSDVFASVNLLYDLLHIANADLPLAAQADKMGLSVAPGKPLAGPGRSFRSPQDTPSLQSTFVDTGACDTGSFVYSWDDADGDLEMSSGDSYEVTFDDCYVAQWAETLTGSTYITGTLVSGDVINAIPPWSFAANYAFDDLVCTWDQGSMAVSGNFSMFNSCSDGLKAYLEFSSAHLTVVVDGAIDTFSNFRVVEKMDLVNGSFSIHQTGTLTRDLRNGTVSFTTPEDMAFLAGDGYPSSGELLITHGASSIRAIVVDNSSVQLAIDADGDGIAETTLSVLWTELIP